MRGAYFFWTSNYDNGILLGMSFLTGRDKASSKLGVTTHDNDSTSDTARYLNDRHCALQSENARRRTGRRARRSRPTKNSGENHEPRKHAFLRNEPDSFW